jgi:hypothetical protein
MALLPDVHVNLGQVTFERIYQIFLPLIPGGSLIGGLLLAHPDFMFRVTTAFGLGRFSRIGVLVFAVYVTGLVLYGVSQWVVGICSWIGLLTVSKRWPPMRDNLALSKRPAWRRLAAGFLGDALTPSLPPLPPAPAAQASLLEQYDYEWQDVYNALQDYVLRGIAVLSSEFTLLWTYLQSTGWAMLYLYLKTNLREHWSVLLVSVILVFSGATLPYATIYLYWKYDRLSYWDFMGRLLHEIRTLEAERRATQKA